MFLLYNFERIYALIALSSSLLIKHTFIFILFCLVLFSVLVSFSSLVYSRYKTTTGSLICGKSAILYLSIVSDKVHFLSHLCFFFFFFLSPVRCFAKAIILLRMHHMILNSIAMTVHVLRVEEGRTDERHSSTVPLVFQSTSHSHHVSCIINVDIQDIRLFHCLSSNCV